MHGEGPTNAAADRCQLPVSEPHVMTDLISCPVCGRRFEHKKVGAHWKQYCSPACKSRIQGMARQWALAQVEQGLLSVGDLLAWDVEKRAQASCTTAEKAQPEGPAPHGDLPEVHARNARADEQ